MHSLSFREPSVRRYVVATVVPIILLFIALSISFYDQVKDLLLTDKELTGTKIIETLYTDLTDIQQIRGYTQISLWRHNEVNEKIAHLKKKVLSRFQDDEWIETMNELGLYEEADRIRSKADAIFNADINATPDMEIFTKYSRLISDIVQLMCLVTDRSYLVLDPDLNTYYLIEILVKQIPSLVEYIGKVRGFGSGLIAKGVLEPQDIEQLKDFVALIRSGMENLVETGRLVKKTATDVARDVKLPPPELEEIVQKVLASCQMIIDRNMISQMDPESFFVDVTKAIDVMRKPYEDGIYLLHSRLAHRKNRQLVSSMIVFLGTLFAIAVMLYFNRLFYLYNRRLYRKVAALSITDQLTGLYNRRYFFDIFSIELRKTLRHRERLYLAMLDVDNFKRYNDTYGHPEGDMVLKTISKVMQDVLRRAGDYCFRIGGEEFCMIFSARDIEIAARLMERLRHGIESLQIVHKGNPPRNVVTVSIGLMEVPNEADVEIDDVMAEVDKALYAAKNEGRNRCCICRDSKNES